MRPDRGPRGRYVLIGPEELGEGREARLPEAGDHPGTTGVAEIRTADRTNDRSSLLHEEGEYFVRLIVREQLIARLFCKGLKILY